MPTALHVRITLLPELAIMFIGELCSISGEAMDLKKAVLNSQIKTTFQQAMLNSQMKIKHYIVVSPHTLI